jgi:hypothetical protein
MLNSLAVFATTTTSQATTTSDSPIVVIILALISASGVILTGFFSYMAQKHARSSAKHSAEVNDAVNHRKPGQDRLFDMVASTYDTVRGLVTWKEQWDSMPTKLQEPQGILSQFNVIEDRIHTLGERLDTRVLSLYNHIDEKVDSLESKVSCIDSKLSNHITSTLKLIKPIENNEEKNV